MTGAVLIGAALFGGGLARAAPPGMEIRVGGFLHDARPLMAREGEENGVGFNAEILSPPFVRAKGGAALLVRGGVNIAPAGISAMYGELVGSVPVTRGLFVEVGGGGAIHDADPLTFDELPAGETSEGRRLLGRRVLFHFTVAVGYRLNARWSVQVYADHMSNANTSRNNEGLDNTGLRFGYVY